MSQVGGHFTCLEVCCYGLDPVVRDVPPPPLTYQFVVRLTAQPGVTAVVEGGPQGQSSRALSQSPHHFRREDPVVEGGQGDVHVVVGHVRGKVASLENLEMLVVSERNKAGVSLPEGGGISSPGITRVPTVLVVAQHSSPGVVLRLKQLGVQSNQRADQPVEIISDNKN